MGFTNKTPNYDLPQWIGTDQPTWLVDVNGAFSAIDTAISDVNVTATGAKNTADSASGLASTAKDAADAATQAATDATTAATAATNAATAATEKATQAEQTASAAAGTASTAITNANNAVQVANSAENKADQALAQAGVGTWYKKILNTTDLELINGITANTSYYIKEAVTLFYNSKLNLMNIDITVNLSGSNSGFKNSVNGFNNDNNLYFFPTIKLPFSYNSGNDILIKGLQLLGYSMTPDGITGYTGTFLKIIYGGIKMYNNSAWLGIVSNRNEYSPGNANCIGGRISSINTQDMGEITLNNWTVA